MVAGVGVSDLVGPDHGGLGAIGAVGQEDEEGSVVAFGHGIEAAFIDRNDAVANVADLGVPDDFAGLGGDGRHAFLVRSVDDVFAQVQGKTTVVAASGGESGRPLLGAVRIEGIDDSIVIAGSGDGEHGAVSADDRLAAGHIVVRIGFVGVAGPGQGAVSGVDRDDSASILVVDLRAVSVEADAVAGPAISAVSVFIAPSNGAAGSDGKETLAGNFHVGFAAVELDSTAGQTIAGFSKLADPDGLAGLDVDLAEVGLFVADIEVTGIRDGRSAVVPAGFGVEFFNFAGLNVDLEDGGVG